MRQAVTISLSEDLSNQVDQVLSEEHISRSDLFREAISEYLYFKQLKKMRDRMLIHARQQGIHTDEDVFRIIS